MDILNVVFEALGSIVTGIVGVITDAFTGVVGLWYTAPTATGGTGSLTMLAVNMLILHS